MIVQVHNTVSNCNQVYTFNDQLTILTARTLEDSSNIDYWFNQCHDITDSKVKVKINKVTKAQLLI